MEKLRHRNMDSAFEIATINRSRINEIIDWINTQEEEPVPEDKKAAHDCRECYFAIRDVDKVPCVICRIWNCFAPREK